MYLLVLFLFTVCGFGVSCFLVYKHYAKTPMLCPIGKKSCSDVTESKYATTLGVRNDFLGALFYLGMMFLELMVGYLPEVAGILYSLIAIGFTGATLFAFWLIYVQARILHDFCVYCLAVSTATIFSFLTVLRILAFYL